MTKRQRAFAALAALALLWGYNWVVMKIAVQYAGPFSFAAWRTLGGAMLLLVVAVLLRRPIVPRFAGPFLAIGIFQTAGFVGLVTWAIVASGVGQVAMLAYTMPFWVALLGWPLLHERLNARQVVAVAIAAAGVACMIGPLRGALSSALALGAGGCWAIGVIVTKRLQAREDVDVFNLTLWQLLFGGVVLAVVAIFVPERATEWSSTYVAVLVYNIAFATALAYLLWLFVLRELPARDASMGTLVNPIIGALAAWIQLGERPPLLEVAGMALVVTGLFVLSPAREQQ